MERAQAVLHDGLGRSVSADAIGARAAQQCRTQAQGVRYNRAAVVQGIQGELTGDLSVPRSLTKSQRC